METAIDYLNEVHGDLLDAARRERAKLRGTEPRRPRRDPAGLLAAAASLVVVAGLIGLLVRSGGLGDDAGRSSAATGATGETGAAHDPAPTPVDEALDGGAGVSVEGAEEPGLSRVIRTAEISVVIPRDAFDQRFGEAVDAAEEHGGFVAGSRSRNRSGSLTIRVPAGSFDETLRALRALGRVEVESIRGQDVTADYIDLRARLRIAKARREVLLGLLAEAATIEQTIRVQNALDETQLDIERIQGNLRLLDDRTSLATIRVDLREEGVEPEPEVETPSIPNAFERAVAGFVGVIAAIVIGLGYLLPLLVLGLVAWFAVTRARRRRGAS